MDHAKFKQFLKKAVMLYCGILIGAFAPVKIAVATAIGFVLIAAYDVFGPEKSAW